MPDFDSWLDDAAARCAKECGLDPERTKGGTDYSSVWAIEYDGELTLAQLIRVARFMNVEHEHDGGTPARHLMMSIYDRTGRITSSKLVEDLARTDGSAYPLDELPPGARAVPTRWERLRKVDPQDPSPHT